MIFLHRELDYNVPVWTVPAYEWPCVQKKPEGAVIPYGVCTGIFGCWPFMGNLLLFGGWRYVVGRFS